MQVLRVGRQPADALGVEFDRIGIPGRRENAARLFGRHRDLFVEADLKPDRHTAVGNRSDVHLHVPWLESRELHVEGRGAGRDVGKCERAGRTGGRLAWIAALRGSEHDDRAGERAARIVNDDTLDGGGLRVHRVGHEDQVHERQRGERPHAGHGTPRDALPRLTASIDPK